MDPFDPLLDQPETIDYHSLAPDSTFLVTNDEIHIETDRDSDLRGLYWAWHGRSYARSIRITISAPLRPQFELTATPLDALSPVVLRRYPGYQETIYGAEGVVISKRLFAPFRTSYQSAALWLLELQTEGDRLLRIQIDIDWGEALEQRMVDGLLVAQLRPGEVQGPFDQRNAESTRVFGTSQGPPDQVHFPDARHAQLVYHVLAMGYVDLPLILTLSDVGEQLAWNGFLALRDIGRIFQESTEHWAELLAAGEVWTPFPPLNRAVRQAKIASTRQLCRLPTGWAPFSRAVTDAPGLVSSLDTFQLGHSRDLLAHLRELARQTRGRLPRRIPDRPEEPIPDPGREVVFTNGAYLTALAQHLDHHANARLLEEHYTAVALCGEALVKQGWQADQTPDPAWLEGLVHALAAAQRLAERHGDSANAARWESEAQEHRRRLADLAPDASAEQGPDPSQERAWLEALAHRLPETGELAPGVLADAWAVWRGCGLRWQGERLAVEPGWPRPWAWWALLDLPTDQGPLSLLWDGETLHSTQPVAFSGPTQLHAAIRALGREEERFDLHFELLPPSGEAGDGEGASQFFRPRFEHAPGAA